MTTIALAGNPNSGKTTLFNELTGARQHVGNYPGVTVELKEGTFSHRGNPIHVVDLPGIYSITAYSLEEIVTRNYLVREIGRWTKDSSRFPSDAPPAKRGLLSANRGDVPL